MRTIITIFLFIFLAWASIAFYFSRVASEIIIGNDLNNHADTVFIKDSGKTIIYDDLMMAIFKTGYEVGATRMKDKCKMDAMWPIDSIRFRELFLDTIQKKIVVKPKTNKL